jgi:GNAT superfamily N-acetyltransferase
MMLVRWKRFTWELNNLPTAAPDLNAQFKIRPFAKEEEKLVRNAISSAFRLDADWSDALNMMQERFDADLDEVFAQKDTSSCLVLTHGTRIIGASALNLNKDAFSQLASGPSILVEYRNRGLGTALLYHSLQVLKDEGLHQAHGMSKANMPAAKFLYPKFNSVSEEHEFDLVVR